MADRSLYETFLLTDHILLTAVFIFGVERSEDFPRRTKYQNSGEVKFAEAEGQKVCA